MARSLRKLGAKISHLLPIEASARRDYLICMRELGRSMPGCHLNSGCFSMKSTCCNGA